VDVAPQFHLEIDGIALGGFDAANARWKRASSAASRALRRPPSRTLTPGSAERRKAWHHRPGPTGRCRPQQQGQAQRARLVVRRRPRPVAGARADLGHRRLQGRRHPFQRQAEDAREGILRHARGQALHLGRGQCGQAIRGRHEAATATVAHNSLPSSKPRIMQIWVDADACPGVIKEILFRAATPRCR
jgi:hypothetical protein